MVCMLSRQVIEVTEKGWVLCDCTMCMLSRQVIEVTEKGRVRLDVTVAQEPDFTAVQRKEARLAAAYFPSKMMYAVADIH